MPNPCEGTRWQNEKGETFVVTALLFWVHGDSIILKNEKTGHEYERTVKDFQEAFRSGKLKYAPDLK